MNEIQTIQSAAIQVAGYDYSTLDSDVAALAQAAAGRIKNQLQTTRRSYIDIGNDLIEMKEKLGHGRFGPWLETEFAMSVRFADDCMASARLVTKFAIAANLPPTILVALASPSADPGVIEDVLADAKAGKVATAAVVKEKLAEARDAKKKAEAAQKKTPEEIKKEQAARERSDLRWNKKQEEIDAQQAENKARKIEAAEKAARILVTGLGAAKTKQLFTIRPRVQFDLVEQLLGHRSVVGDYTTFLPEAEIEAKFGGGSVS